MIASDFLKELGKFPGANSFGLNYKPTNEELR
jgi:hypothetical protein